MKVKIFSTDEYYEHKERDVNHWLADHPNIKVVKILQSESQAKKDSFQAKPLTISIFYEDTRK